MKKCPNPRCNKIYSDDDYVFCYECGADLVPYGETRSQTGPDNVVSDSTFTGGVHSQNSNSNNAINSNNTTTNTTIYQAPKTESEVLYDNLLSYRLRCKELYVNGIISSEGIAELRELQFRLNLSDDSVNPIKDEIRRQSIRLIPPTPVVRTGIEQTITLIEQNSPSTLERQLKQLEAWMGQYDDDTLRLMYFQLSAILEPGRFAQRYAKSLKSEYWEVFWAHIAFLLLKKEDEAFGAMASLGRLQAGYPSGNETILHLTGKIMQDDSLEGIRREHEYMRGAHSPGLGLLHDTIDELIGKDWTKNPVMLRPMHRFYIDNLFSPFVETQMALGEKERRKRDDATRIERERLNEIERQKDILLRKFRDVENIEVALFELDLYPETLNEWLDKDTRFQARYNEIARLIGEKKREEEERRHREKILAEKISNDKSKFLSRYSHNNGDWLRTCTETGLGNDTVTRWRNTDNAFDEALRLIEEEYDARLRNDFIKRYAINDCDLLKTCSELGTSRNRIEKWRNAYADFDDALLHIEREKEKTLRREFLGRYKYNDCDFERTCDELALDRGEVRKWRACNKEFDEALTKIEREYENKLQAAFLKSYEANNCDFQKACIEKNLSPEEFNRWHQTNPVFANSISRLNRDRRIKIFKKVLPYILIVFLLIAGIIAIFWQNNIKNIDKEELYYINNYQNQND